MTMLDNGTGRSGIHSGRLTSPAAPNRSAAGYQRLAERASAARSAFSAARTARHSAWPGTVAASSIG